MPIINGRRVTNIPDAGVYGTDIINEMNLSPGRRPVMMRDDGFEQIEPRKRYSKRDVIDRKGRPVKVADIPDRTKGDDELFMGARSSISKAIIKEQVYAIADNLFKSGVSFDEDNADWMVVPQFRLPKVWHHVAQFTPLLIMFPTRYPEIPPIGFYMRATINTSVNGHFYQDAYHDAAKAPLASGWKWYCVYVQPGTWQPAAVRRPGDWQFGDNLWTYFTLINEVLASPA